MNFMEGRILKEGDDLYFDEDNFKVKISPKFKETLEPYSGKEIVFGVRPEHIYEPESQLRQSEGVEPIKAKVEILEPMGAEVYVYLTTGKTPFIARLDPHLKVEIDETLELLVDMEKTHFFDKETEKAVV